MSELTFQGRLRSSEEGHGLFSLKETFDRAFDQRASPDALCGRISNSSTLEETPRADPRTHWREIIHPREPETPQEPRDV